MSEKGNRLKVQANPAKSFFVSMLIKDITLRDAIGDLVDNAVDAIKACATDKNDLSSYKIEVHLNENEFTITDNGQGMSTKVARLALNEWEFEFNGDTLQEDIPQTGESGFKVKITELSDDAKTSFCNGQFVNQLQKEIEYEHMLNIGKGLEITINDYKLRPTNIALVCNDEIRPTYWEKTADDLMIKIMAGISSKSDEEGGWYVFCNDRLILAKDKSANTVWTGRQGDGVPLWHAQYHRFRGFVFFEAKDSSNLPWNTTKTGMDMDSPIYQKVRSQMIIMTKQVMDLMDKLKSEKEKDNPAEEQKLNIAVEQALKNSKVPVLQLRSQSAAYNLQDKFVYPEVLYSPAGKGNQINIQYFVPKDLFQKVKSLLKVKTGKEVGQATFDYYCENEL